MIAITISIAIVTTTIINLYFITIIILIIETVVNN